MDEIYINIKNMNECAFKHYLEKEFKKDLISIEEIMNTFEELKYDYDDLEEQFEDFKQDVEDNYRPVSIREQIDYNERW